MSFQIKQGLFKFDFTDYHAVLGVPIDASIEEISKRYRLYLARRLHPDSCGANNEIEKKMATQLFSKLVSPAYSKLSHEREKAEYGVLLKRTGQRLIQEPNKIELLTEAAKQLAKAGDLDNAYHTALNHLAQNQYESLNQVLNLIGQISELNLVYLLRKESKGIRPAANPASPAQASPSTTGGSTPNRSVAQQGMIDSYCRRAEDLIKLNDLARAKSELQSALKLDPNSSRAHGLMGMIYIKQNQPTAAKSHINKALQLNPQEPIALEAKKKLEPGSGTTGGKPAAPPKAQSGGGKAAPPPKPGQKPPDKSGGGGFFGGLFGGGKKK